MGKSNKEPKAPSAKKNNVVANLYHDVKDHWSTPAEGNQVGYKEIVAFSGGGVGVKTVNSMGTYIQMTPTCLLMGSVYGLSPSRLMVLFFIATIVSIIKMPLASWLVDNTNTKMGKFRPYLLWAGIPCLLGVFGLVFLVPVNGSPTIKMVMIAIFFNIYSVGQQLYNNAYMGLSQVISSNSGERNKIMSLSEFVANLGPSIVQFILPVCAGLFFGAKGTKNAMLDLRSYQVLLPIFAVLGFVLGLVVMFMTKERVLVTKASKEKVKFLDGLKIAGVEPDFWIVGSSKFFEGFRAGIGQLLPWICMYQLHSDAMYGILPTITAIAFIPGMLLAPILLKKLGSGKAAFSAFFANFVAALIMLLTFKKGVAFFVIALFLFNFASGPQYIMQTSINADSLDKMQLKKGQRVEGFVQNFQLMLATIGSVIAQLLLTFIFEKFGLAADAGTGETDYGVLTDAAVREPIITWIIVIAMISSVLSALPFLLCKMTYKKHQIIIEQLQKKKFMEDHKGDGLSQDELEALYIESLQVLEESTPIAEVEAADILTGIDDNTDENIGNSEAVDTESSDTEEENPNNKK